MVVEKKSERIICTSFCNGRRHDFRLWKESRTHVHPTLLLQTDTGYLGLSKLHPNSSQPKKRSKKHPLTRGDRRKNREISRSRVLAENVIRKLKIFRIFSERYRNRRKRFGLRINLIAALYNFNLSLPK